jgi:hypothetical protein
VAMREVFIHQDSARVGLCKSILDSAGIDNFVRNGLSNNSVTDMPSPLFFPALCVLNDEDYEAAIELLRKVIKPESSNEPDWKCRACGEEVPGTFDTCWKCGAERETGEPAPVPAATPAVVGPVQSQPSPEGNTLAVVNFFRWLLIVGALWEVTWHIVFPAVGFSAAALEMPSEVKAFLTRHGPSAQWLRFAAVLHVFHKAFALLAFPLCFCFSAYGRVSMLILLVIDSLAIFGYSLSYHASGWALAAHLHTLTMGALLAMMYLPPLSGLFARKT